MYSTRAASMPSETPPTDLANTSRGGSSDEGGKAAAAGTLQHEREPQQQRREERTTARREHTPSSQVPNKPKSTPSQTGRARLSRPLTGGPSTSARPRQ